MPRNRILALSIFFITAGVMIIWTAIRYNGRDSGTSSGTVATDDAVHSTGLHEASWDQLPKIPDFALTERSGKTFDTASIDGEAYIVSFFFSKCPSICRNQNEQIALLQKAYHDQPITFLSITCDPKNDTPVNLRKYADVFQADPEQWLFLTGDYEKMKGISEDYFNTAYSTSTHGTNLMLVDKWGRFRDRFDWQDKTELLRLRNVVDTVLAEEKEPAGKSFDTRTPASSADVDHGHQVDWKEQPWINEFQLTERSGEKFSSEAMRGKVWIGSFFFVRCPSICKQQNNQLAKLQDQFGDRDVTLVSITTNPKNDTLAELRKYADQYEADKEKWLFVRGDLLYIRRIAAEYFQSGFMEKENHTTSLALIDKWGEIRGKYAWEDPEQLVELRKEVDRLLAETEPPTAEANEVFDEEEEIADSEDDDA